MLRDGVGHEPAPSADGDEEVGVGSADPNGGG